MKRIIVSVIVAVLLLSLANIGVVSAQAGSTVYVDASNTGTGNGSQDNPFNTIQEGINAAKPGDMVEVAAGTYSENITLKSWVTVLGWGSDVTTINGSGSSKTVIGADNSTIMGFTITGGSSGIYNDHTSPTIDSNIITGSSYGIVNSFSSPTINNNIIKDNTTYGIYNVDSSPTITSNVITGNQNGIVNLYSSPTIANNIITNSKYGSGIYNNRSSSKIINNTIYDNTNGIRTYFSPTPTIANNIIANNVSYGIWNKGDCDIGSSHLTTKHNDIFSNDPNYREDGTCVSRKSVSDMTADPLFEDAVNGDYRLQAGSPCIDAGDNASVPDWLTTDCAYNPRIVDGDGDGSVRVDMGAFEYIPYNTPPGDDVTVSFDGINVTFSEVTGSGDTTFDLVQGEPPSGFQLVPAGTYYDISTTADYTGSITIAIDYSEAGLTLKQEQILKLMHLEDEEWVDITDSVDTENDIIYGTTTSLSPFGVMLSQAVIDINPDTLNLGSKVKWVTAYIELPKGYDVNDIDVTTVLLNEAVEAEERPIEIGDYDSDGTADLMVKFDGAEVQDLLDPEGEFELTVSGELTDGTPFDGSDTIRVIDKGKK